jgi:hypothetical protein
MLSGFLVLKRKKRQRQTRKEDLQKDVIAGLKRLSRVRPELMEGIESDYPHLLEDPFR